MFSKFFRRNIIYVTHWTLGNLNCWLDDGICKRATWIFRQTSFLIADSTSHDICSVFNLQRWNKVLTRNANILPLTFNLIRQTKSARKMSSKTNLKWTFNNVKTNVTFFFYFWWYLLSLHIKKEIPKTETKFEKKNFKLKEKKNSCLRKQWLKFKCVHSGAIILHIVWSKKSQLGGVFFAYLFFSFIQIEENSKKKGCCCFFFCRMNKKRKLSVCGLDELPLDCYSLIETFLFFKDFVLLLQLSRLMKTNLKKTSFVRRRSEFLAPLDQLQNLSLYFTLTRLQFLQTFWSGKDQTYCQGHPLSRTSN